MGEREKTRWESGHAGRTRVAKPAWGWIFARGMREPRVVHACKPTGCTQSRRTHARVGGRTQGWALLGTGVGLWAGVLGKGEVKRSGWIRVGPAATTGFWDSRRDTREL